MPAKAKLAIDTSAPIEKARTGIRGLDKITGGGLPRGRTSIVCGGPGCGKTMLGVEFLVRGATEFNEPGVLLAFEESPQEITRNVASLGFRLNELTAKKKLFLDHIRVEPSEIQETGEYDLEGLFIRLEHAITAIGAKRVMLDTIEALFSSFPNEGILRAEFRRLFGWLKERGMTTVITAERGDGTLTREGLEEYVSDCVILLDHRVKDQISMRRMRIVKYRGTQHGLDEYPFLIDDSGISILPLNGLRLQHKVTNERVSTGVPSLDDMLEGKGFYRGSSILIAGTAGTGKTTLCASFANETCRKGNRCLYLGFEESTAQVERNMSTLGIDLHHWIQKGLLHHEAWRPTQFGLEMHLLRIHKLVDKVKPSSVIIDPITNLLTGVSELEAKSMLMRLVDYLKGAGITAVMADLTHGGDNLESTELGISSLTDTWILLRDIELNGERNRCIYVLKSRGMEHSNQLREFVLTSKGIQLIPAYVGAGGVLTGSSRVAQQAREQAEALAKDQALRAKQQDMSRKRAALEAQIALLQAELAGQTNSIRESTRQEEERVIQDRRNREVLIKSRRERAN